MKIFYCFKQTKKLEESYNVKVNRVVVKIAAERIMNGELNPKTNQVYILDDVTNENYRIAVEDYILQNTEGV